MKKGNITYYLLLLGFLFLGFQKKGLTYNVIDRYKLLEDRFKTEDMLRPIGHDFFLDVTAALNKNLQDLIDDAENAADTSGSIQDKVSAAQTFLNNYKDTEQTARLAISLGFPLFSFKVFGWKIVPDFRVGVNWGLNLGIRTEALTVSTILSLIPNEVPDALKTAISDHFDQYNGGDDLVNSDVCNAANIPLGAECDQYKNKAYYPDNPDIPNIFTFTKLDGKGGLLFNYFKEEWFGYLNVYALHRTDYFIRLTAESIAHDKGLTDIGDELNSHLMINLDYKLGYKYDRFSVFALIEEIKLTTLDDNDLKGGKLIYGTKPLIRIHGDALFNWDYFSLVPFFGIHNRSGYGVMDGIYLGGDFSAQTWGDRLSARFRAMFDKEHITLSPRLRLWFMQLEYSLKKPLSSSVDGVEVSTLHSVNFRLFI